MAYYPPSLLQIPAPFQGNQVGAIIPDQGIIVSPNQPGMTANGTLIEYSPGTLLAQIDISPDIISLVTAYPVINQSLQIVSSFLARLPSLSSQGFFASGTVTKALSRGLWGLSSLFLEGATVSILSYLLQAKSYLEDASLLLLGERFNAQGTQTIGWTALAGQALTQIQAYDPLLSSSSPVPDWNLLLGTLVQGITLPSLSGF